MPLDPFYAKAILDWTTGAATGTAPAGQFINWVTGTPNASTSFEGNFTPRLTVTFAAAFSPTGSATIANSPIGTATAVATANGWNLYDAAVAGSRIMYGSTTAVIGCASGNNITFPGGSTLTIVLR